ncbi:DUF551 domain-containing protein [Escherichia coli]|nr:DUF551 domain-containing protein [Escherichia coli]
MTFTKEQLIEKLKHRISVASEFPESEKAQMDLDLARIALASLEAEPVAYIFKHPAGKLFWALTDESNKDQSDVIPVYAAPPVPVVPEEKPMPNPLKMYAVDAVAAIAEVRGWNSCRAAMLHGAEPVSQTYKSQHTQFEQVADLYEMQFDDGRTCAFHTDAQKAAQWLQACDGNRVQEYVKLERLRNALSGNSPVTPDSWISCSERMPDTKTAVLVAVEFDRKGDWRMKWATYIPGHPDANDGWIIPGASWKPSHWMPLPEPPQEVK